MSAVIGDARLIVPRFHFEAACSASRAHSALARHCLDTYGDHGALISGVVRSHFPDAIKDQLRTLARQVGTSSDSAYASRPARVHTDTLYKLSREVATLYGSGFYGPQAGR